jgi:nitroreductase/NAD-dependent dihydropyrimidine dehydrogenase PreA subunit
MQSLPREEIDMEGLLVVDEKKCVKDGLCADECPARIIESTKKKTYPRLIPGGEAFCIACGHCVAVCPKGALSHRIIPSQDCPVIKKKLAVSEEQTWQMLRSRRSIRRYEDKPVEREKIEKLIGLASHAPTGGNSQTLEWLVLTDRAKLKALSGHTIEWIRHELGKKPEMSRAPRLQVVYQRIVDGWDAGRDTVLWDAPVLLVACAPGSMPNGFVDLVIALTYLELAAPTLGLGTCWAGLLRGAVLLWPQTKEMLALPEGYHHFPMMLGYPTPRYYRLPIRKTPRITWK